jgi:hypothetical protein
LTPPFAPLQAEASAIGSFRVWLVCFSAFALLSGYFWVFYPAEPPKARLGVPLSAVALTPLHPADAFTQDSISDARMPVDLYKFALNAFLAPLLDDNVPPKWTYVGIDFMCDAGTTVMVDGEPMVSGKTIPVKPFTLRWEMDRCIPFGRNSVELTGSVELVVVRSAKGLSATVTPVALRVDSFDGRARLRGPFKAEMAIDTFAPMPQLKTARH